MVDGPAASGRRTGRTTTWARGTWRSAGRLGSTALRRSRSGGIEPPGFEEAAYLPTAPPDVAGLEDVLGFTPGRRRSVVLGQATTIAAVALVLGVPLGAVVGLLVLLNLIAAFPAVSARRLRVAEALRSE